VTTRLYGWGGSRDPPTTTGRLYRSRLDHGGTGMGCPGPHAVASSRGCRGVAPAKCHQDARLQLQLLGRVVWRYGRWRQSRAAHVP